MLDTTTRKEAMTALVGEDLYPVWAGLRACIEAAYDMDGAWGPGGKAWTYEYKYRRGGKTLCALYAREGCIGFLVIFGKKERLQFEAARETYPQAVQAAYDAAKTYHDRKWILLEPVDTAWFPAFMRLLGIKRTPNRKPPAESQG